MVFRWVVAGRVQGVGYRRFVWKNAVALGLKGTVRNLPDGSVEIAVSGSQAELDLFKKTCTTGPYGAFVSRIEESLLSVAELPALFEIRY